MSGEPSAIIDGPLALRRGLAEIRDCQEELQSFSAGIVEQLAASAAELLRRQQAWLAERSEMQRDLDRRDEACRRQRAELAAEWEQLARVHEGLAAAHDGTPPAAGRGRAACARGRHSRRRRRETAAGTGGRQSPRAARASAAGRGGASRASGCRQARGRPAGPADDPAGRRREELPAEETLTVLDPREASRRDFIAQALLASTASGGPAACRVVSADPDIGEADLRELAAWGPAHDALLDRAAEASSLNFHPLPSGAYCVSLTRRADGGAAGRRGLWTQCLVVPPQVLARFANDAFALARAARAAGAWQEVDPGGSRERLRLPGGARAIDEGLVLGLADQPGPAWMAALVQASLDWVSIGLSSDPPAEQLIAGLIHCFPPGCRTEFFFSTGLRFSPERPPRIVAVPAELEGQRRLEQLFNLCVLRLAERPPVEFTPVNPWARLVLRVLRDGRTTLLDRWFSRPEEILLHDLPAYGLEFLEEIKAAARPSGGGTAAVGEAAAGTIFRGGPADLRSVPAAPPGSLPGAGFGVPAVAADRSSRSPGAGPAGEARRPGFRGDHGPARGACRAAVVLAAGSRGAGRIAVARIAGAVSSLCAVRSGRTPPARRGPASPSGPSPRWTCSVCCSTTTEPACRLQGSVNGSLMNGCHCWLVQQCREHCWISQQWHPRDT